MVISEQFKLRSRAEGRSSGWHLKSQSVFLVPLGPMVCQVTEERLLLSPPALPSGFLQSVGFMSSVGTEFHTWEVSAQGKGPANL